MIACDASVDHNDFGTKRKDDGSISRCSDCEEGPLGGLRVLDAANNRLSTVPSAIACLASLTVLNLTSNRLTSLPPEIGPHSAARTHRTHRTHTHTHTHNRTPHTF